MSRTAIEMLTDEHHSIMKVVEALRRIGRRLERDPSPDLEQLREVVRFMREFADRCHHGKEEDLLFPALEAKGVPESGCPLGALRSDHVKGRSLVGALSDAIDALAKGEREALGRIRSAIEGICELYPGHIWREDEMVFPMVDRLLSSADRAELQRGFEKVEREIGGEHAYFERFAETLQEEAPRRDRGAS